MTLKEFLSTASPNHIEALAQAKVFSFGEGALIPATTLNQMVAKLNLTGVIADIADDPTHIARHKLKSVLLSIQGNHPFNFIEGTTAGDGNLLMLDWLITEAMPEYATQLTELKQTLMSLANRQTYPFANVTLHDVLIARNACPKKVVQATGRYVVINTTSDCEKHNPRLLAFNTRLSQWQRINSFYNVEQAGTYEAEIPSQWFRSELAVDDCYGIL